MVCLVRDRNPEIISISYSINIATHNNWLSTVVIVHLRTFVRPDVVTDDDLGCQHLCRRWGAVTVLGTGFKWLLK